MSYKVLNKNLFILFLQTTVDLRDSKALEVEIRNPNIEVRNKHVKS
jgi:hypothetical protein